jgi:hypothetical protein
MLSQSRANVFLHNQDPELPSFVSQTNALIPCARASLIISAVLMFGSAIATMIARITVAGSRQLPSQ